MIAQESSRKHARRCALAAGPVIVAVLAAIGLLTGCGGSSSATPSASVIDLNLKSPGIEADGSTKPNVHCGWGMTWLPLEWEGAPDGSKELAIYIGRFKYVHEGGGRKLTVPYAALLYGIEPSVRKLPANAFLKQARWSNFGPSSCPVAIQGQRVMVEVFALDRRQFEWKMKERLAVRLTEEALADTRPANEQRPPGKLTEDAAAVGRLITTYPGPHSE